ncbi:MAG: 30S ribosomal protein S13 [Candidatus Omnitrophica bacterium]|nr:30S ribosomal protein S13 [Candidatus Omnitrophota bacterium]
MARILGVDLPKGKRVDVALCYLYGVGPQLSRVILEKAQVGPEIRVKNLTDEQVTKLTGIIQRDYKVEGDLKRDIAQNIKRLVDIGCYRGIRHRKGLPVRGQRTHTNARTRKGPRRILSSMRPVAGKPAAAK